MGLICIKSNPFFVLTIFCLIKSFVVFMLFVISFSPIKIKLNEIYNCIIVKPLGYNVMINSIRCQMGRYPEFCFLEVECVWDVERLFHQEK